jgi:hypothetical protein
MLQQFHYLFSYWIFIWYVLYELQLVSYNPKGALIVAFLENIIGLCVMIYYSYSYMNYFILINFFFKVLPLWSIIYTPYYKKDLYATIVLFCIYLLWLYINKLNILDFLKIIKLQIYNIKHNKPIGPLMYLLIK